ncbi:MAG: DUF4446 family protein [Egibacteraceae bacterium]
MDVLVIVAVVTGAVAFVLACLALVWQRRVLRAYQVFSQGERDDVLTLLKRHIEQVGQLREDVAHQTRYAQQLRALISGCVSRIGTVRYDAFDDMGGRLSFSIALLDERGDGAVLTAINGRTETRAYAKAIAAGESRHNLSQEEIAAITQAQAHAPANRQPARVRQPSAAASAL